jgi:prepilin-type N-terminal cleavage/methylation domain-containing protein
MPSRTPAQSGFTLLEILIALVLCGLILVGMPVALRLALRSHAVTKSLDEHTVFTASVAFIEQRLSEATPTFRRGEDGRQQVSFAGSEAVVSFVAPTISGGDTPSGLAQFELGRGEDSGGRNGLVLSWSPAWPQSENDAALVATRQSRLVVPNASGFALRYFGAPSQTQAPVWAGVWERTDQLPDLVEFTIQVSGLGHHEAAARIVVLRLK